MIYMHSPEWYWAVQDEFGEMESRGAINVPISGDLDIAGWDLKKALGLLFKSNPPLFEWLRSPITYRKDDKISKGLLELSALFYSQKSAVHHYLHMAEGNFRQYLLDRDEVKRKKYLYVIRPILACRWIEKFHDFPPMEIDRTMVSLDGHPIRSRVLDLIADKRNGTELGLGLADKELEAFLGGEIDRLKELAGRLPEQKRDMATLNEFFRSTLRSSFSRG